MRTEKEEVMETFQSSATANVNKLRATSFFPLQKLKGSQLAVTPSVWMVHLEEKSTTEEEGINGEDPDGIKGMTEEFILASPEQWKTLNRWRSIAIIVTAQDGMPKV